MAPGWSAGARFVDGQHRLDARAAIHRGDLHERELGRQRRVWSDGREDDELAQQQPGYLGAESAREAIGITVSYWATEDDARAWKRVLEHAEAQRIGRERWYEQYSVRVATVTREYGTASHLP